MSEHVAELHPQTRISRDRRHRAWGVQCSRIKRDGTRCRRYAISGGFCCPVHGGQLPNVRKAASARLARLAPPAVLVLEDLLSDASPPAVRLRTAKYILRLTGVDQRRNNPHARSNVPGPKSKPQAELSVPVDVEIEALLGTLLQLESAS
jgi:hypothetical protein